MSNDDWLASGGSYVLLSIIGAGSAIAFGWLGIWAGKASNSPNDGCLLALGNVVLALLGAGLGFLLLMRFYPVFILGALLGAVVLPSVATLLFLRKTPRH